VVTPSGNQISNMQCSWAELHHHCSEAAIRARQQMAGMRSPLALTLAMPDDVENAPGENPDSGLSAVLRRVPHASKAAALQ
jgi:hypothetical protein